MDNQNNRNFTRENEDRFLFKTPAVPLFPAAASTGRGPAVDPSNEKPNQMKQENMRPGQPFWKMMTQSDKSPLHSVNQGEGGPSHGMGNNQNRGGGNDGGGPFRRNFRGAGEIPPFNQQRDGAAMNPFLRGLPLGPPPMEGNGNNFNHPMPQTFDYNHGVPAPGGPIGQPGPNMVPPDRPEGGMPPGPRPLMEVTIPNPAALFKKLHATLDNKEDTSSSRDPRQAGHERRSPRQRNDPQKRQAGPSSQPGDQHKQKGSPNKGGKAQNEAWNRGLKRMAELQNQLIQCGQTGKKRKTETNTKKKPPASKPTTPPVLEYDAESLKLMDAIAQGSQPHQLQLVRATGIKENFTGRDFIPWKCYICNAETWTWQAYIIHCKTKAHKSQAIGLGTTFMKDEKTKLLNVLRKLPYARVSFPLGKKDSGDGSGTDSVPSSTPPSTTFVMTEAVNKNKGMFECKPCGRFFLQRDRLQNHVNSDAHLKREAFLKQRYGNSWLDYHWYNQSKKTERRDAEPLGVAFVLPVSGYFCKLCSRFYNSEITAKDVHCRQIGHIEKVKEWDRQQLTKKEAIKLKLNATEIETAVKNKEELATRKTRWSRPKLNTNPSEVFVVDSDPEDESDKSKSKEATERGKRIVNSNVKKEVSRTKDEDLEEGELSEAEVLRMEKQQQEDKIREEWMKRELKKKEKEEREKEQREKERKEKEAKERKEREAKEEMERQRVMREREKSRKAKEEKERKERERLEREKMMKKLQEEKKQLERKKKEFQEQVEREKREKEEKERQEREKKEKLEKARKMQEEQEKKLRETRLREMLELETRIRQQEKRERDLLEERVQLGQMLAMGAGTRDGALIERDMRDKEIRGRVVREQLDKDIKQLEELKRLQLEQVTSNIAVRQEKDTRAKVEAEMKKAEEKRLREERLKEVEKREKELQEIEKREQERQRIEEKERELLEIEMRDTARREQELQERREQEMLAIRELERKARLEEEMQARQEHELQARREQEMKARQEQEMEARHVQEMQARHVQEMKARQEQEMQARREQGMKARQEEEMKARQEQEMKARQEQEMKARQEQEMKARQEEEMQTRQEQEMQAMQEQELQARQEQEMLRMREQEILARREQDIQAWQMREAQMVAEGVSEMEILQQRQVFQQQLEEKYSREGPLAVKDVGVTGEARNSEMERELFLNELRQQARGELMMKAMQLQREGLTDDEIQEVMAREEEIMKERIIQEMQRRGFTDVGAPSGCVDGRETNPAAEQGMAFGGEVRDQDPGRRDREWDLIEQEMIERERSSREREVLQRSPGRDYDERDNVRYYEEADGRHIEGVRNEPVRYDRDYPPSPGNYSDGGDYDGDDGPYEEEDFDGDYDNVQGNDEDERYTGSNRDDVRVVASNRDSASRQIRPPRQRAGDRRRRRRRGGRGARRRQGRGGAAQRGR